MQLLWWKGKQWSASYYIELHTDYNIGWANPTAVTGQKPKSRAMLPQTESLFILAIFCRCVSSSNPFSCLFHFRNWGRDFHKKKSPSIILGMQDLRDKNRRRLVYLFLVFQPGLYFLIEASVTRTATRNEIIVLLSKQTRRLMSSQSAQRSVTTWHPSLPVKCPCPKVLLFILLDGAKVYFRLDYVSRLSFCPLKGKREQKWRPVPKLFLDR
jgi:hypothetical protein